MNQYKYIITKYIMETETEIYFYGLKNDFGYMSNFYKTNFIDKDGIKYHCSEQYFMYHKCKIFDPSNNILRVAPVKNRFGPHTADGRDFATLFVDFGACQIGDADSQGRAYLNSGYQAVNQ